MFRLRGDQQGADNPFFGWLVRIISSDLRLCKIPLAFLMVIGRVADVLCAERNHVAVGKVIEGKWLVIQSAHEISVAIDLLDMNPHFLVRALIDGGIQILKADFDEIADCDF